MADRLILCSGCGATNQISSMTLGQPKCVACGQALHVPAATRRSRPLLKRPWVWVIIAGLAYSVFTSIARAPDSGRDTAGQTASNTSQASKPAFDAAPINAWTGVMRRPSSPGVAPLGITTGSGNDYYVKLVDTAGQTVMTMYVEGGRSFETKVPLGTYEMRYAIGKTWYGPEHHFGPDTAYAKADNVFHFTFDGSRYSGYRVELISRSGGNLRTKALAPGKF